VSLFQLNEGVAVITLDHPPVNALALALRRRLADGLYAALADPAVRAVVIAGAGRGFCGGGDITEFDLPTADQAPAPMALFAQVEGSHKPVVAALHGMALGGGLELAMACHARVANAQTQVGLPEVHLGLVPGAGGTQRLPRLVGLELALNLIVQGQTLPAHRLRDSGLFDVVTEGDAVSEAIAFARRLAAEMAAGGSLRRTGELAVQMPNAQAFLAFARAGIKAQARGLPAPPACVDCVEAAATLPFQEGLNKEFETFLRLRSSPQSAGLRHAFLAERAAAQIRNLPGGTKARPVDHAAVIGAGTMGAGIAVTLANAGITVTLIEREQGALDRGLATIRQTWEGMLKKGRLTAAQLDERLGRVRGALTYDGLSEVDLAIEAVFEDIDIKRAVFEQLDRVLRPGAVLASNTSMLDLDRIASFTKRPHDVVGLHFFSPAHVMKLLEVVRGKQTAPDVIATAMALARRIGKTAVVSGVCDGFIGNRMLEPYMQQAGLLLDEGALPQQVDGAMERWGMAMGPFRVNDLAGNDLGAKIRQRRVAEHPSVVYSRSFTTIVEMGRYGQKVGRGWYDYRPGERAPVPNAEVNAAIEAESKRLGITRRNISDEEIVDRLLLALANEGARILAEGIAQRSSDIDVVYTAGYGFPRWRGGPMFAAELRGLTNVLATMQRFAHGPAYQQAEAFWQPAPLLIQLTQSGQTLRSLNESEPA
jgi:3-hydroxyacyl-CoA dehydrogenase